MLKYVESAVTFSEFPDEISLTLSISNCPNNCPGCSESYLAQDIGTELTTSELDRLLVSNPGITLVGFMGGDASHSDIIEISKYIHEKYNLKVGMYSGRDYIDLDLVNYLDYYKFGSWRCFSGNEEDWKNQYAGPLSIPTTNQVMLKKENNTLINITDRFMKIKKNNWKNFIL